MKSSQVLLHNCQGHSTATFRHKEGAERTEPERTRNDRASKRTAAVKKRTSEGWQGRGQSRGRRAAGPAGHGPGPSAARLWRGAAAEARRLPGAASEKPPAPPLFLEAHDPRPGCAGRSRRQERPLPPQAFVHEAQIPAVAVSVLILDSSPRGLHGTGDGERGRNRRPAQGLRARNTPPGLAGSPARRGRAETPTSNRRRALSCPDGVAKPEAGDSPQGVLPFTASMANARLAVKRDIFAGLWVVGNNRSFLGGSSVLVFALWATDF